MAIVVKIKHIYAQNTTEICYRKPSHRFEQEGRTKVKLTLTLHLHQYCDGNRKRKGNVSLPNAVQNT